MKKRKNPWISIIACLVVQLCVGILYLWSALRADIVKSFSWSDSAAGMVSSYMILTFVFGNLIGGFLNDKKGPKLTCVLGVILFSVGIALTAVLTPSTIALLNVTYAVMAGLGSGFAYGACISCIQKWLPQNAVWPPVWHALHLVYPQSFLLPCLHGSWICSAMRKVL